MTTEDREQLRLSLIRWLATKNLQFGAPTAYLVACAMSEAWPEITKEEINAELEYLADATNALGKSLVTCLAKLSPENRSWKLTAAGREFAAQRGLDRI